MLSSTLRAGRRISPRCVRHFAAPSDSAPLLLGAPVNHGSSSHVPLAIGSGRTRVHRKTPTPSVEPVPQLSPDHGLYGFFRRKADPNLRGDDQYETFHDQEAPMNGRSWEASELRLKSFKDLHTLWYVLLRECNVLATQREEMRRMGVLKRRISTHALTMRCKKSMARIKGVMNERRLAYEGAAALVEKEREDATNAEVLKFKINAETTEWHKQHTKQLREKLIPPSPRTQRAGVKVRARREGKAPPTDGERKARWTKAQKLAHAPYREQQLATGASSRKRGPRVHVA
ncbi:mitochondrial 39-S ribosomal protein L47 (MRP-L47)-domain-containing protein [Mycena maculata]|uniref:Large ribosomal subunit protein uL29m n=1 Tax=Mycena maculata TaxID=230809 RepID=A0AAD7K8T3_9AGAR|nr:mitochondrial 39-S ribosomal protein L47 (MRP-L47)-domain-containing protein [Mycena maculata]